MKKCIVLSENSYTELSSRVSLFRNVGAMEVARRFRNHGYHTTQLEWFNSWEHDDLLKAFSLWLSDQDTQQVIAISITFSLNILFNIRPVLEQVKKTYPHVKIIVGGNRANEPKILEFVDDVFIGRSMEILEDWIRDQDMHRFATKYPGVYVNRDVDVKTDIPVIPEPVDDDILNSSDILGFEIGIGCKFDCTFCSFDLRGIKNPTLVEAERLRNFLQTAYDKYGVFNFYIADDTVNEQDTKLEILASAVEQLTYKPNIVCYMRVDLLEARPQQYDLIRRCNITGINFGIETLNPHAAKLIKKSTRTELIYKALRQLRTILPDAYLATGLIVGLTKDNKNSIWNSVKKLTSETLVHSISPYSLAITLPVDEVFDDNYLSSIAQHPEKYGYTITPIEHISNEDRPGGSVAMKWKNDWSDSDSAEQLAQDVLHYIKQVNFSTVDAFEWLVLLTLGIVKTTEEHGVAGIDRVWSVTHNKIKRHKQTYISNKLKYLEEHK